MRDTVNLVRLGVPTVGLVHHPFETLARLQAAQLGLPDAPILIYPQDLPSKDPAELVRKKAEEVAERVVPFLLGGQR